MPQPNMKPAAIQQRRKVIKHLLRIQAVTSHTQSSRGGDRVEFWHNNLLYRGEEQYSNSGTCRRIVFTCVATGEAVPGSQAEEFLSGILQRDA